MAEIYNSIEGSEHWITKEDRALEDIDENDRTVYPIYDGNAYTGAVIILSLIHI